MQDGKSWQNLQALEGVFNWIASLESVFITQYLIGSLHFYVHLSHFIYHFSFLDLLLQSFNGSPIAFNLDSLLF